MLPDVLKAAQKLEEEYRLSPEVIDLRTVAPWDVNSVLTSFKKTGVLVIAHKAVRHADLGAEIAATIYGQALDYVDCEIARVGSRFAPTPFAPELERFVIPGEADVVEATLKILAR